MSFSHFINFIGSLEVIFKQLGTLLSCNDYLPKLAKVLICVLTLAKEFNGHLKTEDDEILAKKMETGQQIYHYVGKQCKTAVRKGLKIIKQLYSKFSNKKTFIMKLTATFYDELVEDQLDYFDTRYISDRS